MRAALRRGDGHGRRPVYTDVRTGVDHGLCAILVLSGEGTLADIETMHIEPDLIFARLGSMIPYL